MAQIDFLQLLKKHKKGTWCQLNRAWNVWDTFLGLFSVGIMSISTCHGCGSCMPHSCQVFIFVWKIAAESCACYMSFPNSPVKWKCGFPWGDSFDKGYFFTKVSSMCVRWCWCLGCWMTFSTVSPFLWFDSISDHQILLEKEIYIPHADYSVCTSFSETHSLMLAR